MTQQEKNTIFIGDLDKARVLAALYNASRPLGMGLLHFNPKDMTVEEAQEEVDDLANRFSPVYFDYLHGRVMKISLDEEMLYTGLYNRDNGDGAAEEVIAKLRLEDNPINLVTLR